MKVLLIRFDPYRGQTVTLTLRQQWRDLEVHSSATGGEGLFDVQDFRPDVVLVAMKPGDMDGLDLLHKIRSASDAVIMALSEEASDSELVAALEAGADDYLGGEAVGVHLTARICASLRRAGRNSARSEGALRCGDLKIDPATYEVSVDGAILHLTPTEFKLLYHLARNRNRVMTPRALEGLVWGSEDHFSAESLRKYVQRLRRKLEAAPSGVVRINTVPRYGYRLQETAELPPAV